MLEQVQQRQQPAPGVAQKREALERPPPLPAQGLQVGDVLAPADRRLPAHRGLPAAPLVVVEQGPAPRKQVVLGEEVVVVRAGAAVQHDDPGARADVPREQPDAVDRDDRRHRVGRQSCSLPGGSFA